jgi:hypothetical protein
LQTTTFNAGHLLVDLVRAAPYCHYGTKKELFNFDKDVKSISINRWAHAYAHGNPGAVGRQPFARITIANSDSIGGSGMPSAVAQAWRAVKELG